MQPGKRDTTVASAATSGRPGNRVFQGGEPGSVNTAVTRNPVGPEFTLT
jgi:hypothetical protein